MPILVLPGDDALILPGDLALSIPGFAVVDANWSSDFFIAVPRPGLNAVRMTNPARTELSDPDGLWMATLTDGSRTVRMRKGVRTFTEQTPGVTDAYDRIVSSGWGGTEASGKWLVRTGDDTDFTVSPGWGAMRLSTVNASRRIAPSNYGYIYSFIDCSVTTYTNRAGAGAAQEASIMGMYLDANNHYLATLAIAGGVTEMGDNFGDRTSFSTWGASPEGLVWEHIGGSAGEFQVSTPTAGLASIEHTTVNAPRTSLIEMPGANDQSVYATITYPTAVGASIFSGCVMRYADASNHYRVRIERQPDGDANLIVDKVVAGTVVPIETFVLADMSGSTEWWRIRCDIQGNDIRAKAWLDGQTEPAWQIEETDASISAGSKAGVTSVLDTGFIGTIPQRIYFNQVTISDLSHDDGFPVTLSIQKRLAGTTTTIAGPMTIGNRVSLSDQFRIRLHIEDGVIRALAYRTDGDAPDDFQLQATDYAFEIGDVGLRSMLGSGYTGSLPVSVSFGDYSLDAQWANPPTVTHDNWVYVLDEPFDGGRVPYNWLYDRLYYDTPDVLIMAQQYASNSVETEWRDSGEAYRGDPSITPEEGSTFSGDAKFGPRDAGGDRTAGADFNDYLGAAATYDHQSGPDTVDAPEAEEILSLDAAGFVRMMFGLRLGVPLQDAPEWPARIPRTVEDQNTSGPGIVVATKGSAFISADLAKIAIGDVVFFIGGSIPGDEEGLVPHNGVYLGLDGNGLMRFVSSRKVANGPTMADVGGASVIQGSGLYARTLRSVRRF